MELTKNIDLAAKVHEALILTQRRNRATRAFYPSPSVPEIDAMTMSIIHSISISNRLTPTQLSAHLRLSPSRISRLIESLSKANLMTAEPSPLDLRSKLLQFTPLGERYSDEINRITEMVVESYTSSLSDEQHNHVRVVLDELADHFCAFARREHSVLASLKDLTAGLGMLSDRYVDTDLTVVRYQLLFDLWSKQGRASLRDIAKYFLLSPSSLSRECSTLAKMGYLKKSTSKGDKRALMVSLTERGEKLFEQHHYHIASLFADALCNLSESIVSSAADAMYKASQSQKMAAEGQLQCFPCTTEASRKASRAFLVETLVYAGEHHNFDGTLLPRENECFVVSCDESICGVIELRKNTEGILQFNRVVTIARLSSAEIKKLIIRLATLHSIPLSSLRSAQVLPNTLPALLDN